MNKKWYDDWKTTTRPLTEEQKLFVEGRFIRKLPRKNGLYTVSLPHTTNKTKTYTFHTKNKKDDKKVRELISLLDSALTALTQL